MPYTASNNSQSTTSPVKPGLVPHSEHQYATGNKAPSAQQIKRGLAKRMAETWILGMPPRGFLDELMQFSGPPIVEKDQRAFDIFSKMGEWKETPGSSNEAALAATFVNHFNQSNTKRRRCLFPGLKLVSGDRKDPNTKSTFRIDANAYATHVVTTERLVQHENTELHIEFKDNATSPFKDKYVCEADSDDIVTETEFNNTQSGVLAQGQLIAYQLDIDRAQHRLHTFSLSIVKNTCRFIRHDHTANIVTHAFDYREQPWLGEFFHRFSRMTPEERGLDTRFHLASPDDIEIADDKLQPWADGRQRRVMTIEVEVDESLDSDNASTPASNAANTRTHNLIIWHPVVERDTSVGRGTVCYVAWDTTAERYVFYKECWYAAGLTPERDILRQLLSKGVRNVPTILGGSDHGSPSLNGGYGDAGWNKNRDKNRLVPRKLGWVLLKEVGDSLRRFRSSRELLTATRDALIAHQDAYEKCGALIHRDVSANNILIVRDAPDGLGRGLLIDWELAKDVESIQKDTHAYRTGTWHYMSSAILRWPSKRHQLQDDFESFVNVVVYLAFRYLESPLENSADLGEWMDRVFNAAHCADSKQILFSEPQDSLGSPPDFPTSPPLVDWFLKACQYTTQWHRSPNAKVKRSNVNGRQVMLLINPGPVPDTVAFHSHKALIDLWDEALQPDKWTGFSDAGAVDRLPGYDAVPTNDPVVERAQTHQHSFTANSSKRKSPEPESDGLEEQVSQQSKRHKKLPQRKKHTTRGL